MGISVGIGGVSRAGKTTLSHYLRDLYSHKKTLIISMDQYVKDPDSIPRVKDKIDWEHPVSVDFEKIQKKIEESVQAYDLVITEGILIFYNEQVNELFDKRIFIDIPKSLFYIRRKNDTRWGDEPSWYIDYVWESYLEYGKLNDSSTHTLYLNGEEKYTPMLLDEHLFKIEGDSGQISA
jgi:nicotinamide/nicotinate riboside kinase